MSYEAATCRLMLDASQVPLGNITQAAATKERMDQEQAISAALHAGMSEKDIYLAIHDGQSDLPSAKVSKLIETRGTRVA